MAHKQRVIEDQLGTFFVVMDGDRIQAAAFRGSGCAISMAAASLMTESVKGRRREEVADLIERFRALVTGNSMHDASEMGKLQVFAGLRDYRMDLNPRTYADVCDPTNYPCYSAGCQVHKDGEIHASTLWDMRERVGRDVAALLTPPAAVTMHLAWGGGFLLSDGIAPEPEIPPLEPS